MSFLITKFIFFYITSNSLVDDSDDELSSTGIFENQLKSEKKVNKVCKKKEVLISSDHPVMVCNNTMNKLHKCVFCKCYECYMIELKNEDENGNLVDKLETITRIIWSIAERDHQGVEKQGIFLKDRQQKPTPKKKDQQLEVAPFAIILMIYQFLLMQAFSVDLIKQEMKKWMIQERQKYIYQFIVLYVKQKFVIK